MEDKPIFKFKKATSRMVGDFDVNDKSLHTLLIKREYQDFPKFVHFEKLWNVVETNDEYDTDEDGGNIIKQGVKARPMYKIMAGFVRDEKFIVTRQESVSDSSFTGIHKKYLTHLQSIIDRGFIKDVDNYNGNEPIEPIYYVNERTPMKGLDMSGLVSNQQLSNQIAVGIAKNPPKNPMMKLFPTRKKIGNVNNTSNTSDPTPNP